MYKKMILNIIEQNVIGFCWQRGKKNMGVENIEILTSSLKHTDCIRFKVTLNNAYFNNIFNKVSIYGRVCTHRTIIDVIECNSKQINYYFDSKEFDDFDFSKL